MGIVKFDMHVLKRVGIHIKTTDIFDTMVASWLCDENTPNGLKENSAQYLKVKQEKFNEVTDTVPKEVRKEFGLKANNRVPFDLVLIDDGCSYALADAFYTWELYLGFLDKLEDEKMHKIYDKVYRPFLRVLFDMEEQGVCVDLEKLESMGRDIKNDMENLKYEMFEVVGVEFNPSSGQQLAELLFGYRKLNKKGEESEKVNEHLLNVAFNFKPLSYTNAGAPQTDSDTLWQLSHMAYKNKRKQEGVELCKKLSEYKKLDKLNSAFVEGLKEQIYDDGRVHPSFNIVGTESGRLSCAEPNMQQLPRVNEDDKYQIRSLFIGSEYMVNSRYGNFYNYFDPEIASPPTEVIVKRKKIIALDYGNLEVRVASHWSKDEKLLEMFAEGKDIHGSTAVNMFELDCDPNDCKKLYPHLRQVGKILNFGILYGMSAPRLYLTLKEDHFNPIDLGNPEYLKQYGVKTGEEVAQIYIDKYFESYKGVAKFIKDQKRFAHRNGYVYTVLQRKRRLPDINSSDRRIVGYCERLSVNSCVQGTAADITMSAQNRISKDLWLKEHGVTMLLQVHDELVFECPEKYIDEAIQRIKRYMEHPFGDNVELNLPLTTDAGSGDTYAACK